MNTFKLVDYFLIATVTAAGFWAGAGLGILWLGVAS